MAEATVYDLLVAGGGPAGIACALRARELGLAVVVVEADEPMSRVRDYRVDLPIVPDFGKGAVVFPEGGPLIEALRFEPVEKGTLVDRYRGLLDRAEVEVLWRTVLEGLEERQDGWSAICRDMDGARLSLDARHVVLALGRGQPLLEEESPSPLEVESLCGGPVLVVGNGARAAHCAVEVAERSAKDGHRVFWSHRGRRMPRLPIPLARLFFESCARLGNLERLAESEVFPSPGREDTISVRIDRRVRQGEPDEVRYLEFPSKSVVFRGGPELPEDLLNDLGIAMKRAGRGPKRVHLGSDLETRRKGVFAIGAMLAPAYYETEGGATTRRAHADTIRAAAMDGARVAEAIAARLEEKENARASSSGRPVLIGENGERYRVRLSGPTRIGRRDCELEFPDDPRMAHHHATLEPSRRGWLLTDENSRTGVFSRLHSGRSTSVPSGTLLRAGRQLLLIVEEEEHFGLVHFNDSGQEQGQHRLEEGTITFGREASLSLAEPDPSLSRRHLEITVHRGVITVRDLDSSGGTYRRIIGQTEVAEGDRFLMGSTMLTFREQTALPEEEERTTCRGGTVTFAGTGSVFPVRADQTLLEVAAENNIWIRAECRTGTCGSDPLEIVEGWENLVPPEARELEILREILGEKSERCRLACLARVRGPVVVAIVEQ